MAIKRVWHGWTTPENADLYEKTVRHHVAPSIKASGIQGYRGLELFRIANPVAGEVEFMTIMTFDSLDNIVAFQGTDYTRAHVPDIAQKALKRWDNHAVHYEVCDLT